MVAMSTADAMAAASSTSHGNLAGIDPCSSSRARHPRRGARAIGLVLAAVITAGCGGAVDAPAVATTSSNADAPRPTVVVHRTAACSCCGGYEDILTAAGFEVQQRMHDDVAPVRARLGVPDDQQSCHTLALDGYAAEGHVPIEALDDLLTERPDVDGIALAGMPLGSPGMPGEQAEPFVVILLRDGEVVGELGRY